MRKVKCPGDCLDILLIHFRQIDFDSLEKEPSIDEAEAIERAFSSLQEFYGLNAPGAMEFYGRMLRRARDERGYAQELSAYGNTPEEILDNLRSHVLECLGCSISYLRLITGGAAYKLEADRRLIAGDCPDELREIAARELSMGLADRIKEEDERFLGLLK